MIDSNELIKKDFISTVAVYQLKNRKRFNETVEERSSKFRNLEKISFSVYQNLIDLFKNLGDGYINPKKVSKNQMRSRRNKNRKSKNHEQKTK